MGKRVAVLVVGLAAALGLLGCSAASAAGWAGRDDSPCYFDKEVYGNRLAPGWHCTLPDMTDGMGIYAKGTAVSSSRSFADAKAKAYARVELAASFAAGISQVLESEIGEVIEGTEKQQRAVEATIVIVQQAVGGHIIGSREIASFTGPDGSRNVLIGIVDQDAIEETKKSVIRITLDKAVEDIIGEDAANRIRQRLGYGPSQ